MTPEERRETLPEAEMRELARKFEEKKRELRGRTEAPTPEREIFREVLREHIEVARRAPPPGSRAAPAAPTAGAPAPEREEDREETMRSLVDLALTRTIQDAVTAARNLGPYFLDELHDRLADEYYEKLIRLRKLKAL